MIRLGTAAPFMDIPNTRWNRFLSRTRWSYLYDQTPVQAILYVLMRCLTKPHVYIFGHQYWFVLYRIYQPLRCKLGFHQYKYYWCHWCNSKLKDDPKEL